MDQVVYETLLSVADSDFTIRSQAEARLKELASAPEYPVSLARLTVSQELAVPHRQLAALTLKTYVTTHWSPKHDDKFIGPEPPIENKKLVREIIVNGLADRESKIRVVSAYVVSKIANDDFPEDWPNLLDILITYLKSNNADSVHGAMRVLLEMVKKDISVQQLPQIGPVLIPELFTILTSDKVYSFRTRGRAVNIFSSCVEMLATLREENPALGDEFIGPIIPQWLQAFNTILSHHVQDNEEKANEEYGLKMDVVKAICTISNEFPKYIISALPQLFEPIWNDLYNLRDRYVQEFVVDTGDVAETFLDSDGNEIGFQSLLYSLFDFIAASTNKKSVRHLFVTNDGPTEFFEQLLYVSIIYMQITQEQAETWSNDANQFVADEEESTFSFNTRVAAIDVLMGLQDSYPAPFFNSLTKAVQRHIKESNESRAASNGDWWKIQEACLFTIGRLSEDLIEALQDESKTVDFDLKSLFDHVVLEDMKLGDYPFLQGRAFVFASEFAKILPADMSSQYVAVAVNALQAPNSGIPVKISALNALNNYCKYLDAQYVNQYQTNILEGTCLLLPLATEESLMLLLDTLGSAVKINNEVAARYEQILTPAVLDIWKKFPQDSIITSYVLDVFEEFARNPLYFPSLCDRSLPFISQVFTTPNADPIVYASAIDLLTAMVHYGPAPLRKEFTEQMYPALMQVAWNVPDNDVLQSAQECLKQFIMKDSENIVKWHDQTGKSGLDYAIHFVAKLLEPSVSDSEALFVGDLIVTMIQKVGNNIASVLPNLLNAVLVRLEATSYQPFIQSLVLVFAHLINSQQESVLEFLSSTTINNKSGLEILMNYWVDNYESFSGYYSLKVSAVALSKIFLVNDPRLQNMSVKGDIIVNPNAGIVTRSRSKRNPDQYTAIPLPVKIVKLLVADLGNCLPNALPQEDAESIGDEEGDWEDVADESAFSSRQEYNFLSDVLANLNEEDDDEENNPDLKNDPIYQTDMKTYLVDFFRNCNAQNINHFVEIYQQLNDEERYTLEDASKNTN